MLSSKVEKFYSPISGHGLKTIASVSKGEVLVKFEGDSMTTQEADVIYKTGDDYMIQVSSSEFLRLIEDTKYVNHSCDPSSAFLYKNGELVALRDLPAGTEITFDYSSNEDTEFKLNCRCGTSKCRGEILPFHKNCPVVQRQLLPILSPYLRPIFLNFYKNP